MTDSTASDEFEAIQMNMSTTQSETNPLTVRDPPIEDRRSMAKAFIFANCGGASGRSALLSWLRELKPARHLNPVVAIPWLASRALVYQID
jgi:hypothetical protein